MWKVGFVGPLGFALAGCSGASAEQVEQAKAQCVELYQSKRMESGNKVEAKDTWSKESKFVVELAESSALGSDSAYTQGLCVVDFDKGEIELPGAFERGRWDE